MEIRSQCRDATDCDRHFKFYFKKYRYRAVVSSSKYDGLRRIGLTVANSGIGAQYTKLLLTIVLCIGWFLESIKCDQGM